MENHSKNFHIRKAIENIVKALNGAMLDNKELDIAALNCIEKQVGDLTGENNDNDILSLLLLLGYRAGRCSEIKIRDSNPAILKELLLWETMERALSKVLNASVEHPVTSFEFRLITTSALDNIKKALNEIEKCYTTNDLSYQLR
ncbi:hypothetical protein [Vibrio algivorus]|uniref:Uncharacterized protein n=1 Tax=Vibrio algivorus TaxID=1667024 RepID=A0A557P9P2_9VIBR|nr:hypothetical protein [Vibrio algivorus]TVO37376.1 hypothetical protein FOF44_07140 [Vibrio algivorus]